MKYLAVAILTVLIACHIVHAVDEQEEYLNGYALLKMIELSDIVVVGKVVHKNYVWRDNIGAGMFTTDIAVEIEVQIKGKPNLGAKHVMFMIQGGQGINPKTGELSRLVVSGEPTFELGERVIVFLSNAHDSSGHYSNYPYGGYYLVRQGYGKRKIVDDELFIAYRNTRSRLIGVKFSFELAINLAKAFMKDEVKTRPLESNIKALAINSEDGYVSLSESIKTQLINDAKAILKEE